MIPPADKEELERAILEEEEEWRVVPESVLAVHCQYCQKLISAKPDDRTPTICNACSTKLIPTEEKVYAGSESRFVSGRDFNERRTALLRDFNTVVTELANALREIVKIDEGDTEFELHATDIWREIGDLGRFMDCSEEHNELISTLHQVAGSELKQEFTHEKAEALRLALEILQGQVILSDGLLDQAYAALREGHFDLNYSMGFLGT